jgi:hypothetical protein
MSLQATQQTTTGTDAAGTCAPSRTLCAAAGSSAMFLGRSMCCPLESADMASAAAAAVLTAARMARAHGSLLSPTLLDPSVQGSLYAADTQPVARATAAALHGSPGSSRGFHTHTKFHAHGSLYAADIQPVTAAGPVRATAAVLTSSPGSSREFHTQMKDPAGFLDKGPSTGISNKMISKARRPKVAVDRGLEERLHALAREEADSKVSCATQSCVLGPSRTGSQGGSSAQALPGCS